MRTGYSTIDTGDISTGTFRIRSKSLIIDTTETTEGTGVGIPCRTESIRDHSSIVAAVSFHHWSRFCSNSILASACIVCTAVLDNRSILIDTFVESRLTSDNGSITVDKIV